MKIFVLLFIPMILSSQVPIIVQQDAFVRSMVLIGINILNVFDALGRKVLSVVNAFREAGVYSVSLNADAFSSGIYFYRLESNGRIITKKMMVLR